ncbi:MAG: deoxyribose-phosphate aldolase [Coriobacteriales bacterium]|nr:deoxyribose-phosphate aldolase [Coriobacteriales bacterium]
MKISREAFAKMIDHTLLKATATDADIVRLCAEAQDIGAASVCVNPSYVSLARATLTQGAVSGSLVAPAKGGAAEGGDVPAAGTVKVCTVVGFPLGASRTEVKAFEAARAVSDGAQEIDMVLNIGAVKSGNTDAVSADIGAVVRAAQGALVKVIIEACYLTDDEKLWACKAAASAGAQFVKTSTGFGSGGATPHDVALMRQAVPASVGVKAAGGIRTLKDALTMIDAGANRLGLSASVQILAEFDIFAQSGNLQP